MTPDAFVTEAARLLRACRAPLIAHLGTDHAGALAAAALARRVGAVIDHAAAAALLGDLDAMRGAGGWFTATPPVAHASADVLVVIGAAEPPSCPHATLHRIAPGRDARQAPVLLGLLRAIVTGRAVRLPRARLAALTAVADALRGARFAVLAWSAEELPPLAVEMVAGLIADLNRTTRCVGLPAPPPDNALGVALALAANTGFPIRVGMAGDAPDHDAWRYDAVRMRRETETDLVLSVDAFAASPSIRVEPRDGTALSLPIGRPGRDHDAVLFDPAAGAPRAVEAPAPTTAPVAAEMLRRIADAC